MSNVKLGSCMKEVGLQKSRRVEGNTMRKTKKQKTKKKWHMDMFFFFLVNGSLLECFKNKFIKLMLHH